MNSNGGELIFHACGIVAETVLSVRAISPVYPPGLRYIMVCR